MRLLRPRLGTVMTRSFSGSYTACYRLGAGSELFKQEKKLKKAMSITTAPDNNPVERRHFREPARVVADSFGILVFLAYCSCNFEPWAWLTTKRSTFESSFIFLKTVLLETSRSYFQSGRI